MRIIAGAANIFRVNVREAVIRALKPAHKICATNYPSGVRSFIERQILFVLKSRGFLSS